MPTDCMPVEDCFHDKPVIAYQDSLPERRQYSLGTSNSYMSLQSTGTTCSLSKETRDSCSELQEDELLALEAIYEGNFSHWKDDRGRLVFSVKIEADLQREREVVVIEQATKTFKPHAGLPVQPAYRHSDASSQTGRRRGRGNGGNRGNGRGRGAEHHQKLAARDALPRSDATAPKADSSLSVADMKAALPGIPSDPPERLEHKMRLQYLLPIELVAILEAGYPLEQPPVIRLSSPWLSQPIKHDLLSRLQPLWQNDVSTFLMVDEVTMALQDPALLPDPLLLQDRYFYDSIGGNPVRNPLHGQLATYDRLTRYSTFSTESFDCGICLESKKGARCFRIRSCNHVFCSDCLHSFFELNIREGLVKNVCCADMECVKQRGKGDEIRGTVELDEIEEIVGNDLLERYKWLMEKQEIESDPTITYCPREGCNAPVPKEKDEEYERLRMCPKCSYSFCVFCRRTYHGTKSRCVFSQAATIVDKYVNGDDREKSILEARYGKTNIKRMVDMYLEEQANAAWIKENSTPCPNCQLDIERSMGCAHMTCERCSCHFCFRCGARLNHKDPYGHYSTPGLPCYNRLFDIQPSAENQWDEALIQQFAEFDD